MEGVVTAASQLQFVHFVGHSVEIVSILTSALRYASIVVNSIRLILRLLNQLIDRLELITWAQLNFQQPAANAMAFLGCDKHIGCVL
jgi:hypothetical protein